MFASYGEAHSRCLHHASNARCYPPFLHPHNAGAVPNPVYASWHSSRPWSHCLPHRAFILSHPTYNCTSSLISLTSSPGLNAGSPMYGHPSHRNASPKEQFPQLPTFPCTVKSTSASSSAFSFAAEGAVVEADEWSLFRAASAVVRLVASSASSRAARPQVQSLQARRRLPVFGRHSGAV